MVDTFSIITEKNCESLCLRELKDRFKISGIKGSGFVDFSSSRELAVRVGYFSQSAKRLLFKIGSGSFKDLDDLSLKISNDLLGGFWFDFLLNSYRVSCERLGVHDFNSVIVEQEVSSLIKKEISSKNSRCVPDYKSRELVFFVQIVDNDYLFGVDFAGRDLSKRGYLLFSNSRALKGSLAFNFLLFSGFKKGSFLLDPFALDGVIAIEAAIFARGVSVNFFSKEFYFPFKFKEVYDSLLKEFDASVPQVKSINSVFSCDPSFPNLASQKKNARIAGVERFISFSRSELRNLDLKNFKEGVDLVCSRLIEPSKTVPEGKVLALYEDFFLSAKEFISKKASVNFVVRSGSLLEEVALRHGFVLVDSLLTSQGQQSLKFLKFMKK